jgi:hypothetical protein
MLCRAVQARNIAITVRTIIVGLMYLATFIFSANALGLTGERQQPQQHCAHDQGQGRDQLLHLARFCPHIVSACWLV